MPSQNIFKLRSVEYHYVMSLAILIMNEWDYKYACITIN